MTTAVTGRVVDENVSPIAGIRVTAVGDWLLTTLRLAPPATTGNDGRFTVQIEPVSTAIGLPPLFNLRFTDAVGRAVAPEKELVASGPTIAVGDVTVRTADRKGLAVTNLTGTPKFVTADNAVRLLIDGEEAFGRIADDIKGAQSSVEMTQLFFALPEKFEPEPKHEKPALIFKFADDPVVAHDPLRPDQPEAKRTEGDRPERLLVVQAQANRTIRILLNEPAVGWPEAFFWLGVLTPLAAGLGVTAAAVVLPWLGIGMVFFPAVAAVTLALFFAELVIIPKKLAGTTDVDEAKRYFGALPGTAQPVAVRGFRQPAPQNGVMHCKMVITDRQRAVVVGSPFSQRYFDSLKHEIPDPHRGSNTSDMVHDMSISVVGPAVHDLHEAFRLFWNEDLDQAEEIPEAPVPLAASPGADERTSSVQVVRTLNERRFEPLGGTSEKGILEGYLRAFAAAQKYIYMETQYFTDAVITDALVAALKAKPALELILVVPIKPDVLFYPLRQAWRIEQLRAAGGNRVGVFTRWSYLPATPRPFVAPVYIHSKAAVIDDSWCTVGSANLDGLSLDYNLLLSPLAFGETMAAELNVNMLPPAPGAVTPFGELVRRRIFSEHLGLLGSDNKPNPNHHLLGPGAPTSWLNGLWRPHAIQALQHVKEGRQQSLPGFVLEYPAKHGGWLDTPRKHLAALGVSLKLGQEAVRPLKRLRKFHFSTGKWDRIPELDDTKL